MPFRYLRDPLFLACVLIYFINRWVFRVLWPGLFFSNHVNDLICIPFWLPILLFLARRLGLRRDDAPPRGYEILIPLILWSAVFEIWLPGVAFFEGLATADHLDVLAYVAGALVAAIVWRKWYGEPEHAAAVVSAGESRCARPSSADPKQDRPTTALPLPVDGADRIGGKREERADVLLQ